jgi:hypothetical protein
MRRAISAAILCCSLAACARFAGKNATEGALDTLAQRAAQSGAKPGEVPVEAAGGKALDGAIAHLKSPENVAALRDVSGAAAEAAVERAVAAVMAPSFRGDRSRLRQLVAEAGDEARLSATRGAVVALGPSGDGPLTRSVSAAARSVATAAADGAFERVRNSCDTHDERCLDRRLYQLSQAAATGFAAGLRSTLGVWALLAAFVLGILLAVGGVMAGVLLRRLKRAAEMTPHGRPSSVR